MLQQQHPCGQRSGSPVFFTGCTTAYPTTKESNAKGVSPKDFENMKLSVHTLGIANSRRALLPLPSKDMLINSFDTSSTCDSGELGHEYSTPHHLHRSKSYTLISESPIEPCSSYTAHSTSHYENEQDGDSRLHGSIYHQFSEYKSNNRKRKNISPERTAKLPRRIFPCSGSRYVWEQLSIDIQQLYSKNKQTAEVYRQKMELRNQLHEVLLTTFPSCGLYVVGSSMTGLGANSSDMDMCLMLSHSEIDQEQEATDILHTVSETFMQYDFLKDVELIPAKVPILRFKEAHSAIQVDLNINNSVGIRNTQLLTSYSRIDDRVPPLVLLTKLWARCHGINDAKNHSLSSYSLVLMVIHYLQCGCSPPVLPSLQALQPEKFRSHSDIRTLSLREELPNFVSENSDQLSVLFLGFLDYFANKFDFQNHVMSVRVGGILTKQSSMNNTSSPKNKRGHWKYLCIEEPFNLTNTACSVFKDSVFYYIKDVFLRSWNLLRSSGKLSSILDLSGLKH